ncbi:oligosaccharide flippase family protein [Lacticaseibacillus brantae]|uniref:Uncharacterized protein n=1 Tax=Lacticaseibacillus brantae DSM 23927 TaxID=1423727 RepID=A0A0R2B1D2_9LACO|nr:oligosaccharide flippase family protein [Lacticaseibacillus brantae]KRM73111.1 hypothetical protein FC34_GL000835 [Lacticaseibacillus brantae DSM 23927]
MRKTMTNIIYNGVYQILILILPFVTTPYVSRVLQPEALGINALINSIPVFLSVVILFGMNQFGVRSIAQAPKEDLPKTFARLWQIQLTVGLLVIVGYVVAVLLWLDYKFFYLLEVPFLFGYVLDISWLFIGLGEIKQVVMRNTVIKLSIVATIFLFVHRPEDLWIYLLINSITYLANVVFWFDLTKHLGRKISRQDFGWSQVYFRSALTVTLPMIAVQFYVSFDQTLVGWLASSRQLSYYSQTQMLARAVIAIVGSISTILMPKMAQMLVEDTGHEQVVRLLKTSLDYTLMVGLYFTIAFMVNAEQFVRWFWGAAYTPMAFNMFFGALIIVLVSYGSVFANQYTLSRGLFKIYSIPYYVGAVVSVGLNLAVVKAFGANGATLVIVATELLVCFLRIYLVRHELPLRSVFRGQWRIILAALIALGIGLLVPIHAFGLFLDLVSQTILLTAIYFGALFALKSRVAIDLKQFIINRRAR